MIEKRVRCVGPCLTGLFVEDDENICQCSHYDNVDPEIFGFPPYHSGCTCYVEEVEIDEEEYL